MPVAEHQQRQQALDSQLQTAALEQQRLRNENANYQTPAQKQQMELDTASKLADIQRQGQRPDLIPVAGPGGQQDQNLGRLRSQPDLVPRFVKFAGFEVELENTETKRSAAGKNEPSHSSPQDCSALYTALSGYLQLTPLAAITYPLTEN